MTHKLCQNVNFENGGTTIQIGILLVLLNILSIPLQSRLHDTSGYFEIQKEKSCPITLGRKLIKFRWLVRTFG